MTAVPHPLKFQIGARTLGAISRRLVRLPLSLDDALAGYAPSLPPTGGDADGYLVTSLPEGQVATRIRTAPSLIAVERQRYTRYWADLTLGFDAYAGQLSGNLRSGLKRKAKKIAAMSGGKLDVRAYRTPDEIAEFYPLARALSTRTYQHHLLDGGLPDDEAFMTRMRADAAAGTARGWLLFASGEAIAYLYCPIVDGTVIYDHVGHDPAFAALSPGSVLQLEAMRDLQADPSALRFDFTEGEGQHKRQFATGGVACVDLLLLKPSIANRATSLALTGFDGAAALGKRGVTALGLESLARRIRR